MALIPLQDLEKMIPPPRWIKPGDEPVPRQTKPAATKPAEAIAQAQAEHDEQDSAHEPEIKHHRARVLVLAEHICERDEKEHRDEMGFENQMRFVRPSKHAA